MASYNFLPRPTVKQEIIGYFLLLWWKDPGSMPLRIILVLYPLVMTSAVALAAYPAVVKAGGVGDGIWLVIMGAVATAVFRIIGWLFLKQSGEGKALAELAYHREDIDELKQQMRDLA